MTSTGFEDLSSLDQEEVLCVFEMVAGVASSANGAHAAHTAHAADDRWESPESGGSGRTRRRNDTSAVSSATQ